jgi:hypothetical protein
LAEPSTAVLSDICIEASVLIALRGMLSSGRLAKYRPSAGMENSGLLK